MPIALVGRGRPIYYDSKKCFDAWVITGSLEKAREYLYEHGERNTEGNKPTIPGISKASYRHILSDPVSCRRVLIDKLLLKNLEIDSEWIAFQIQAAMYCFGANSRRYRVWLAINEFWELAIRLDLAPKDAKEMRYNG